jgi:hypothetical protein
MTTDTDHFGERMANVEGTVAQMDTRLDDPRSRRGRQYRRSSVTRRGYHDGAF